MGRDPGVSAERVARRERAALVGLIAGRAHRLEAEHSLDELSGLAEAAGADVVLRVLQERTKPAPATFLGAGKVVTLATSCAETRANLVIVSMYGRVRTGQARSVALPEPGMKALNELLNRKSPLIGISFGNPYLLLSIPKLQTYLVAYGDMQSLQEATARALLGQGDITGRLPISLPGLYPRGAGIQIRR